MYDHQWFASMIRINDTNASARTSGCGCDGLVSRLQGSSGSIKEAKIDSKTTCLSAIFCWNQLSNEKRAPGWLGYIGDEKLPSYIGIIINHCKDPY